MTTAAPVASTQAAQPRRDARRGRAGLARLDLDAWLREVLHRHPAVGLALGVIRDGRLEGFAAHGVADVATRMPITEDTVFRVGSITKLATAIAILQLWEEGRVDLDAPAAGYLRAYRLVPAEPSFRPPTLRHLLTHTSGIPEVRGLGDLRHADMLPSGGRPALPSVPAGRPVPPLAAHYRGGLRVAVEPGTVFQYSNHGFATLGQIVEDVTGRPLGEYLRERVFEPLGMADTSLSRTPRLAARLATGYALGRRGPRVVPDREWLGAGAGGVYSTTRDIARLAAAILGGGANEHGRILRAATLAAMQEPHFRPDPRLPGMGLGFFRHEIGGHRVVGHDGLLPGFNSALLVAPDEGIGVVAFTNGAAGAFAWFADELDRLMRERLGLPEHDEHPDVPQRPERWPGLCGRYRPTPGVDARGRVALGMGVEVAVRGGRLVARFLTPLPALLRAPLEPVDPDDPDVFCLDLSRAGLGVFRVVFGPPGRRGRATAIHTDLGGQPISLVRR